MNLRHDLSNLISVTYSRSQFGKMDAIHNLLVQNMALSNSAVALLKDFRYGYRQLRRTPGFAIVAVLTLALGIGANTAVFSVMNAVLLRYLPVPDPQRLVLLHYVNQPDNSSQTGFGDSSLSEPVFEALRKQTAVFSDLMAFVPLGL